MNNQILPVLDTAKLQEAANDFAMKGALKSLEEFYSGYNSPYRKALDQHLTEKGTSVHLEIPDIIGLLNETITKEIDSVINTAFAKTFIPLAKKILTRAEPTINFSQILRKFIAETDSEDIDQCSVEINEEYRWGWLNIKLQCENKEYDFTLHLESESKNQPVKKYKLLGLPYNRSTRESKMTIWVDDHKVDMPFTHDVLKDGFISFMARLILAGTIITMDETDFEEEMFPDRCHC